MEYEDEGIKPLKQRIKEYKKIKEYTEKGISLKGIIMAVFIFLIITLVILLILAGFILFCASLLPNMHPAVRIIGMICGIPIAWFLTRFVIE